MSNPSVANPAAPVKGKEIATAFVPTILRHNGRDELFFLPACAACGEAVRNFDEANVVVVDGSDEPQHSLGAVGDGESFRLPGTAVVLHFGCDGTHGKPWNRLSNVLRFNQRGELVRP